MLEYIWTKDIGEDSVIVIINERALVLDPYLDFTLELKRYDCDCDYSTHYYSIIDNQTLRD
jgi:hypothetical protein